MQVRYGQSGDLDWLCENDIHVGKDWIKRCLGNQEYVVALQDNKIIGFLRFSFFWGKIPYMDMVWVPEAGRKQGTGTALFNFWEAEMKKVGAKVLMTSSVIHELEPQTWHKKNGFQESGQLHFGNFDPTKEVFFIKNL
ncbi:MAG: GNAT family N-acetyltransferase [Alphaproteobacteria bacterium]|nr:GNAT family N-acetyltransferase [Alphaproteobacteria bacterium]